MYEIEAKVRLTSADVKRLKKELSKLAIFKGNVQNIDRYFPYSKQFSFRVRKQGNKDFLHLKHKKTEKGIEMNQEIDLPITSGPKMLAFLKRIHIDMPIKKEKKGDIYQLKNLRIELNHIKGLGHFLEIENVVKNKTEIPKAKKELHQIFEQLGFKPSNFEKKYYLELLAEKGLL